MGGGAVFGQGKAFRVPCLLICLWSALCTVSAGQVPASSLESAFAIAYDTSGNLYIADARTHRVFEATLAGTLVVVAGTGTQGFAGDGGPATAAELNQPQGLAIGADGTVYIADTGNERLRAVSPSGIISTVGGTGMAGFSGDGGPAMAAALRDPTALALSAGGVLYLCDTGNHRLRQINAGTISTIAGSATQGFHGDGGPASAAELDSPAGVSTDGTGRIYLADTHNHRIRIIDVAGVITTFAGTGAPGFAGDGGQATLAQLSAPRGLALGADGSLLLADTGNQRVRSINPAGLISTLAGTGREGGSADGMSATTAVMRAPRSVVISGLGLPVFADTGNASISELAGGQLLYPAALSTGRRTDLSTASSLALTYGQNTLQATVSSQIAVPQGQMQATEAGQAVASASLSGGKVSLDLRSLSAGTHTLTVRYMGDGLNPATEGTVSASVSPAALTATANATTVAYGATLPPLTGVLAGVLPQDVAAVSAAFAVAAADLPSVGSYPIVATLTGPKAGNYVVSLSAGSGQLTITRAGTAASLEPTAQAFAGVPLTLTASVAPANRGQPTGTVQFLDGNLVVANGTLAGGVASAVYAAPPGGTRTISTQYSGDANFLPSSSPPAMVAVSALPDFAVGSSGLQTATTTAGGTATYTLIVTAQPGPFTGAVDLSIAGLPAHASANFSPPQVIPGAGSATVTVTVQTAAPSSTVAGLRGRSGPTGVGLAMLTILGFGMRRRRPKRAWICLLGATGLLSGCGARTLGEGATGLVSQSYALQVTGTATNLAGVVVSHSVPLTLTVGQ